MKAVFMSSVLVTTSTVMCTNCAHEENYHINSPPNHQVGHSNTQHLITEIILIHGVSTRIIM